MYQVTVTATTNRKVVSLIKSGDYITALDVLKQEAKTVMLGDVGGNVQQSWEMIPDPNLDPYN